MASTDTQPTAPSTTEIKVEANGEGSVVVANGEGHGKSKVTEWETPGPAAFDFRSDTSTTPTASMLAALTATTLKDDVVQEDTTTNNLESWLSSLLSSSPRGGLLVLSGTMGNQVAMRTHLQSPPHSVLADHRSHILAHEAGSMSMISQAFPHPVHPSNGAYLTLSDIKAAAVLDDNIHHAPTKLIVLENTLGGRIMPLETLREICHWAREHAIKTHLDGARLWEAVASLHSDGEFTSLEEGLAHYGGCVDSVTLCFSKGLGAPVGSILVGDQAFIKRARHVRKMLGGALRMSGIVAAPAMASVQDTFFGGKLKRVHRVARGLAEFWTTRGGVLADEMVETNMLWLDVAQSGVPQGVLEEEATREGLIGYWAGQVVRVVCHYQISDEAVAKLERVFERVLAKAEKNGIKNGGGSENERAFRYGAN